MRYSKDSSVKNKIKSILIDYHGCFCQYCGCDLSIEDSTLDHITPLKEGGSNHISNLMYCCKSCNSSKGTKSLEEFRLFRSIQKTPYHPHISPSQYTKLMELGLLNLAVNMVKFHFEKGVLK